MNLTDKQRLEIALPAFLLHGVFAPVIDSDSSLKPVLDLIDDARKEPLADLDVDRQKKLFKRIARLQLEIMNQYAEASIFKLIMMVYFISKRITDNELVLFAPNSPFIQAMEGVANAVYEHLDDWQALEPSARKQANRIFLRLQGQGYYK